MNYKFVAIIVGFVSIYANFAFAQDADPFAAYEGRKTATTATTTTPKVEGKTQVGTASVQVISDKEVVVANAADEKSAVVLEEIVPLKSLLERNRFSLTLSTFLSYDKVSGSYTDVPTSTLKEYASSNFFTGLNLDVGYVVWQNVTVEASFGSMWRNTLHSAEHSGSEQNWVFKARGWYTYPVWVRAGLMAGLGMGGYFGGGSQTVTKNGIETEVDTNLAGFAMDLSVGVTYVFGSSWQLRMLATYDLMAGKETLPLFNLSISKTTMHFGLGLGVGYVF